MKNVVPVLPSLSAQMLPLWSKTILCTIARPRPVPSFFVVKYGSKMRSLSASGMPVPVSLTAMRCQEPPARFTTVGPHGEHPARRHGLDRVLEQVGEHLAHLAGIDGENDGSGHLLQVDVDGPAHVGVGGGHLAEHLAQGDGRRLRGGKLRELAELAQQLLQRLDLPHDRGGGGEEHPVELRGRRAGWAVSLCFFKMRWAESLIGVRGFLISWASRWAISCHAVMRSACTSLRRERSSSETMELNESASGANSSRRRVRMRKLKSPSATLRVASSRCTRGLISLSVSSMLTRIVMKKMGRLNRKKKATSTIWNSSR